MERAVNKRETIQLKYMNKNQPNAKNTAKEIGSKKTILN